MHLCPDPTHSVGDVTGAMKRRESNETLHKVQRLIDNTHREHKTRIKNNDKRYVIGKLYKFSLNLAKPSPQIGILTAPSLSPVLAPALHSGLTASVPSLSPPAVQCHRGGRSGYPSHGGSIPCSTTGAPWYVRLHSLRLHPTVSPIQLPLHLSNKGGSQITSVQ